MVSVPHAWEQEQETHARPDHPDVPSFARIGCALNIVLSPQRSAGQARYLREEGYQLPVRDEPHAASAYRRHLKASSAEEEAHRLRVTMIRPERNMPEVPRPSGVLLWCQFQLPVARRGSAPRLSRNHVFGVLYGTSREASRGSSFSADIAGGGGSVKGNTDGTDLRGQTPGVLANMAILPDFLNGWVNVI